VPSCSNEKNFIVYFQTIIYKVYQDFKTEWVEEFNRTSDKFASTPRPV